MKKNIVFFISYLVLSLNLFSQEIKESNFSKFKSFFNNNDANSGLNEIPLSLCHKILNNNMVDEYVVSIHACNIYEKGENIYAIIELMYPEGGYSSSYTLILFSNEGKLESSISVGYNMLDADGGVQSKLNMINDSLLEVKKENVKYNDEEKKEVYKTEYSYFVINEQGVNNIEIQEVSKGRLYPKASNIILCLSELKNITKDDLDIMRNEIFADHGYIFKSQKWKDYFADKPWYTPRYEDVNDKLSVIEKINIQTISELSKNNSKAP